MSTSPTRLYFLDWIRVLAFAYLILFHTGMMFINSNWHIESGHNVEFFKIIMDFTRQFRLLLLFLVSGVAISFICKRVTASSFAKNRFLKLLVPLIFASFVVVVPQAYYEAISKSLLEDQGFWHFYFNNYFDFEWLEGMISPMPTYNHMWYVAYLFVYSILLLPFFYLADSRLCSAVIEQIDGWISRRSRVVWAPFALFLTFSLTLAGFPETHALVDDWHTHADSISILIIGFLLARMKSVWASLQHNRHLCLSLAITAFTYLNLVEYSLIPVDESFYPYLAPVLKWMVVAAIIGYARKHLDFSNELLRCANKAVYPFFILHQTVIIVIGYQVVKSELHWAIEFLAIAGLTYLICWVLYDKLIRRIPVLRPLFGLSVKASS